MAITPRRGTEGLQRLAWLLDDLFRIPGTRFRVGLDALIGLLPGGGDLAGGLVSAYTLLAAARLGAPPAVIARLGANILLDAVFGAVPILGDLFDAGFKANRRNVALLQRYIETPEPVQQKSRALVVLIIIALTLAIIGAAWIAVRLMQWIF